MRDKRRKVCVLIVLIYTAMTGFAPKTQPTNDPRPTKDESDGQYLKICRVFNTKPVAILNNEPLTICDEYQYVYLMNECCYKLELCDDSVEYCHIISIQNALYEIDYYKKGLKFFNKHVKITTHDNINGTKGAKVMTLKKDLRRYNALDLCWINFFAKKRGYDYILTTPDQMIKAAYELKAHGFDHIAYEFECATY